MYVESPDPDDIDFRGAEKHFQAYTLRIHFRAAAAANPAIRFILIGCDNLIPTGADRLEVFEFESEEVVPAIAFDEVVLVGVVAAGTFVGEIRIAIDIGIIILEITH